MLAWFVLLSGGVGGCCSTECQPDALPDAGRVDTPQAFVRCYRYLFEHECWRGAYDRLSPRTREEHDYLLFRIKGVGTRIPLPGGGDVPLSELIEGVAYVSHVPDAPEFGQAVLFATWGDHLLNLILTHEELPEDAGPGQVSSGWRLGLQEMLEYPGGWQIINE